MTPVLPVILEAKHSHESLKTLLTDALSKTDVIVTSGGVSMGEKV